MINIHTNLDMRDFSLIYPVHNEALRIEANLESTLAYLLTKNFHFQIVIVNNGSSDKTQEIVEKFISNHEEVDILLINLQEKGLGLAIKAGIAEAEYNHVMFYAIDIPFGTDIIEQSLDSLSESDVAIVIGSKGHRKSIVEVSLKRKVNSFIYNFLLRFLFRIKIRDTQGSLMFKKDRIADVLPFCTAADAFFCGQLIIYARANNLSIKEIPVRYLNPRKDSKVEILKDGWGIFREVIMEYKKFWSCHLAPVGIFSSKYFFSCIVGWSIVFYLFYIFSPLPQVVTNIITIYGFIGASALTLFFRHPFPIVRLVVAGDRPTTHPHVRYLLFGFLIIFYLLINLFIVHFFGDTTLGGAGFMRELSVFLSSLTSWRAGLLPNLDFYFPYGLAPLGIAFLLSKFSISIFWSVIIAKFLLDIFALILVFYIVKVNTSFRHAFLLTIFYLITAIQTLFFASGSLNATVFRYIVLLLPLAFFLSFIKTQRLSTYFFAALSAVFCFFISPETGMVATVYFLLVSFWLLYLFKDQVGWHQITRGLALLSLLGIIPLLNKTSETFFKNSFQYAGSILDGLVSYRLPRFFGFIKDVLATFKLDHPSLIIENGLFYILFVPIVILMWHAIMLFFQACRKKNVSSVDFSIISLTVLLLGYLLKAIGGAASMGYQSTVIIFLLIGFLLLFNYYKNWSVLFSTSIIFIYIFHSLFFNIYFLNKYVIVGKDQMADVVDKDSEIVIRLPPELAMKIKATEKIVGSLRKEQKVVLISDDSPGLYFLLDKPNLTHFINTGFIFSSSTRSIFLDDIIKLDVFMIIYFKDELQPISDVNKKLLFRAINPYLGDRYYVSADNAMLTVYTKK